MMELHDHFVTEHELLVIGATVPTLKAENRLIPATARFNVTDCDKRLWIHLNLPGMDPFLRRPTIQFTGPQTTERSGAVCGSGGTDSYAASQSPTSPF